MRLVSIIGTANPEYGGPVTSALSIASALRSRGVDHLLITLDAPDAPWLSTCNLPLLALGSRLGRYSYSSALTHWLDENAVRFDGFIIHGIWQYQSLAARRVLTRRNRPYLLFVHGALDPWFKRKFVFKHVKKWFYWQLAERFVARDARAVLYTAENERVLAQQSFGAFEANHVVVSHGVAEPPDDREAQLNAFYQAYPWFEGQRLVLFLGRFHEKKGCDLLIRAFASVALLRDDLHLVMAGPDDVPYAQSLRALAQELGVANRVTWTGMLTGPMKWGALRAADVFSLPSHSENFGIALVEALACSTPVLTTRQVNIWPLIEREGAGIVGADTEEGTRRSLEAWLEQDEAGHQAMALHARACYERHFSMAQMTETLIGLFDVQGAEQTPPSLERR